MEGALGPFFNLEEGDMLQLCFGCRSMKRCSRSIELLDMCTVQIKYHCCEPCISWSVCFFFCFVVACRPIKHGCICKQPSPMRDTSIRADFEASNSLFRSMVHKVYENLHPMSLIRCSFLSGWWFGTFFTFPYFGKNNPNWLISFRGLKPPTSYTFAFLCRFKILLFALWSMEVHVQAATRIDSI